MLPLAIHKLYDLIRIMRTPRRRICFIGLTNTLLDDAQAKMIALVVYNLRPLPRDEEPETLEMLRMAFKPETRRELQEAAQRSGVKVLLSDPNGPALRSLGLWP